MGAMNVPDRLWYGVDCGNGSGEVGLWCVGVSGGGIEQGDGSGVVWRVR
jgi:hypothetical protein